MKYKVGLISLGCDKNRVESEYMLSMLSDEFEIVNTAEDADVIVINTCSFIKSSVDESISAIVTAAETGAKLIVTGCLPMRYAEIAKENLMPEVSAFLDNQHYASICKVVYDVMEGGKVVLKNQGLKTPMCGKRILTTPMHYANLRISDGCDNCCAYCAIPRIRGGMRAIDANDLKQEAKWLVDNYGTKEFILVAQDVSRYKTPQDDLFTLFDKLEEVGVQRLRLMYCYPEAVTQQLIKRIADDPIIAPYIDLPLQHIDDGILKAMNRKSCEGQIRERLALIKENGLSVRSTFIAGFPSETEEQFYKLKGFIEEGHFDYAGFFPYFREQGTAAYSMPLQVKAAEKRKRALALEKAQSAVTSAKSAALVGHNVTVMFDYIDYDKGCFVGHTQRNHPEIDTKVFFTSKTPVEEGEEYEVCITKQSKLDLIGETV